MAELTPELAIVGSGSGNSLITPHWDDKRVVIAEGGTFGGTCLNVGCIPTKMFVRPAALARGPEEAARLGVTQRTEAVDWPGIRDRIFSRIDAISDGGRRYRDEELDNVDLVAQRVRLTGPKSFVAEDGTSVRAEQLVIAAGSRAEVPDLPGVDLPQVHTSDTVMRLDELPERVVVVGGGYIACEFAAIFSGLGAEVVQVIRSHRLMNSVDAELRDAYTEQASKQWDVRGGRVVQRIEERADGGVDVVTAPSGVVMPGWTVPSGGAALDEAVATAGAGAASTVVPGAADAVGTADVVDAADAQNEAGARRIRADIVLIALGRRPNSDLVGAAEVGIDLHADGRIAVDEFQRVLIGGEPVDGLYALGDVCSAEQLKHVANHQARVVAHNLEHPDDLRPVGSMPVPAAVFTHPELATVGLTEAEAVERIGTERVAVKVQRYGDTAYGWAMEDDAGIFKVVADRRDGTILGAHVMGYQASNLIQPVVMAMSFGIDARTAARGQYWPHPALMEVAENALLGAAEA